MFTLFQKSQFNRKFIFPFHGIFTGLFGSLAHLSPYLIFDVRTGTKIIASSLLTSLWHCSKCVGRDRVVHHNSVVAVAHELKLNGLLNLLNLSGRTAM